MDEIKRRPGRPKGTEKRGEKKYMTNEQLRAFFRAVERDRRDDFMFNLMFFVGARVQEIANITCEDINGDSQQVTIKGLKGGTTRVYTMPDKLYKKYKRWMKDREKIKGAAMNPYLFITNKSQDNKPISRDMIQWLFRKYMQTAGLKGFYPHSLRHSIAIARARAGHNAVRIRNWLRQRDLKTAQNYVDMYGKEAQEDEREATEIYESL